MPRTSRAEQGAELDGQIAQIQKEMARLVQLVGDVETAVECSAGGRRMVAN